MSKTDSKKITVVYILTTDGRDQFADMALVSMFSVRISNPGCRIVLLCDAESALAIKNTKHRVLDICDEMVSVDTPAGNPTFRNRWIKTQLCNFISGSTLYLDVDTLVREDVSEISDLVTNIGFIPNHNGKTIDEQLWDDDRRCLEMHAWNPQLAFYPNGGVFFYYQTPRTKLFFEHWHRLWLEDFEKTTRGRDQPALFEALGRSGIQYDEMPIRYNFQFCFQDYPVEKSTILHFYMTRFRGVDDALGRLTNVAPYVSKSRLKKLVYNVLRFPGSWPSRDIISKIILSFESRKLIKLSPIHKLWLIGRRAGAARMLLGCLKKLLK